MPVRHILLAVAVAAVWGVNFVVIHVGLDSFPPLLFAALRFLAVALPAVFFIQRPPVPVRYVAGVGLFLSAGHFGLLFSAMEAGMPAGLASLVLQLQAAFTVLLAVGLLAERPRPAQLAGVAVALAGIGVIVLGRTAEVPLLALLLTVGAAASWGLGNVITRVAQAPDALALVVWSSLVPPIPLLALSLALEGPAQMRAAVTGADLGGLLALGYIVVASTFFGFGVWAWLLRRHEASKVAPFTLLVPVFGITTAWLALGEEPNAAEAAGAIVVLAGLALTTGALRRRGGRAAAAVAPATAASR